MGETQKERDTEVSALRDVESQIGMLSASLHTTELHIESAISRMAELQQQMNPLEAQIANQRRLLRQQVRTAYMMGRRQHLKLLLSQDDPDRLSRILSYYGYFNRARLSIIDNVNRSLEELDRLAALIEEERNQLSVLHQEQQQLLAQLDEKRTAREEALTGLDESLHAKNERIKVLQEDAGRLENLIVQLTEAIPASHLKGRGKPFATLRGSMPWPLKGKLVKRFGEKLPGDVILEGVVVAVPEGEQVRAVHDGRVVFADWLRGYGLMMILEHDNGYMSLYGYNQSLLKSVGEEIRAGEVISLSGNSGGHRFSALYFGIRKGANSVNPLRWCIKPRGRHVG